MAEEGREEPRESQEEPPFIEEPPREDLAQEEPLPQEQPADQGSSPQPPRPRGRPRKKPAEKPILDEIVVKLFAETALVPPALLQAFISEKEEADRLLAVKLRKEGVIKTPGAPFEASDKQEIDALMSKGVFEFTRFDTKKHAGLRIFKSRMVNEIKGKGRAEKPYEKSRLVVQGHSDDEKKTILTQSPTIQRASQRLLLALAPALLRDGHVLWLRDITQAYTQSATRLNRTILAHLPDQIWHLHPPGTIMRIVKPLYRIAEAGTHWWATYSKHHKEKLQMRTSSYDPCLLISKPENPSFGLVGIQTDDTLGLTDEAFSAKEDDELTKAGLAAKPKQLLSDESPLTFNGGIVASKDHVLTFGQKGQASKLALVDLSSPDARKQYVEQRARGAYIASICQPEACFDLSIAAQHQDPGPAEIEALNRRIKWQMTNLDRGLTFLPLDLQTAKLFVFVDGSFANNQDLTSQLGFAIILANEVASDGDFTITGNMVHYSSTKCRRVTRSVLASEIYGMVAGVDMAYALSTTLKMIADHLHYPPIPTVVCTDSYSLYECLVKLGTTKEKRLIIDIMALRQSYEHRKLCEIQWIRGDDNVADAFTKGSPNKALEAFIGKGTVTVRMEGWVTRT